MSNAKADILSDTKSEKTLEKEYVEVERKV